MRFRVAHLLLVTAIVPLGFALVAIWGSLSTQSCITSLDWLPNSESIVAAVYHYKRKDGAPLGSSAYDEIIKQEIIILSRASRAVRTLYSVNLSQDRVVHVESSLAGKSLAHTDGAGLLAISSWTRGVSLIDIRSNTPVLESSLDQGQHNKALSISEDGKWLITASSLCNLETFVIQRAPWKDIPVELALAPNGTRIAMVRNDGRVIEYELDLNAAATCSQRRLYKEPDSAILSSLDYTADGRFIVAGSSRGMPTGICVWECSSQLSEPSIIETGHRVLGSSKHPKDGNKVVAVGRELGIAVVDLVSKRMIQRTGANENIISSCFAPSGRYVVTGSTDGEIAIWDARTLEKVDKYNCASSAVFSIIVWISCALTWLGACACCAKNKASRS